MENTVYICPMQSLQHACKILKIGILTKNPPWASFFLSVQSNVCDAQRSHFGLIMWSTKSINDGSQALNRSSCSSTETEFSKTQRTVVIESDILSAVDRMPGLDDLY